MDDFEKKAIEILEEIKKRNNFLLLIHNPPDLDSTASCVAMKHVLTQLGKKATIILGDNSKDQIFSDWLLKKEDIDEMEETKFSEVNFSQYDCYIALDTPSLLHISHIPVPTVPFPIKSICIDHHVVANSNFGDINLIFQASSVTAILFDLFMLWNIQIDPYLATILYAGIFSDILGFKVPLTDIKSFKISAELIERGADFLKVGFSISGQPS